MLFCLVILTTKQKASSRASERENLDKEQQIRELHDQLLKKQGKMFDLEDHLQNERSDRLSYEILFTEMEAMTKELQRTNEKYETTKQELEKWRSRALTLKHVDDTNLTPRMMKTLVKK